MSNSPTSRRLKGLGSAARFVGRVVGSRYNPLLAQVVVTRRCNLACGYCNEYDDFSPPVPLKDLLARIDRLATLNTASITFTGGEPLLHPELDTIVRAARGHGMIVTMITNGFRLSRDWIERLNAADLQGMQISIDNLRPDEVSMKSLASVERKLALLQQHARFKVNVNSVLGISDERTQDVVDGGRDRGEVRIAALGRRAARRCRHAQTAECGPTERVFPDHRNFPVAGAQAELLAVPEEPDAWPGERLEVPAGARYLYVCEDGLVHWCSQRRGYPGTPLLDYTREDIRREFHTEKTCSPTCTLSCVHQMSMFDRHRGAQRMRTRPTPPVRPCEKAVPWRRGTGRHRSAPSPPRRCRAGSWDRCRR